MFSSLIDLTCLSDQKYISDAKGKASSKTAVRIMALSILLFNISGCDNYQVNVHKPGKVWDSYTVPSRMIGGPTHILDMEGNIIKQFDCPGYPAKLLPDGSLLCNNLTIASLTIPELRQVSPQGDILWSYRNFFRNSAKQHHDYQLDGSNPVGYYVPGMEMVGPSEGGNMLVLSHIIHKRSEQDVRRGRLEDDVIYEIDPSGNVLWEWHAKDHIDQMGFSESALKDIYKNQLMKDWLHTNTASYIGPNRWYDELHDERFHPENIIIASPRARWIAIIDKQSGDFVWRMGPDYSEGQPGHEFGGVLFSHHAHIIPRGLPGEGNLLVFDNGTWSGFGDQYSPSRGYSRILEINPIDFSVIWEFRQRIDSPNMSSVQRLPNGNTFIAAGLFGRMVEVTPDKEIVWEAQGPSLYRAYRVPKEWVDPHL